MTDSEVSSTVSGLTAGLKYTLLTIITDQATILFPKIFNDGCYRSFQQKWLDKYPWLVYGRELDEGKK